MDSGVREPSEVIEDEMALVDEVRRASHIEVPQAIFDLIDVHLDAQRDAIATFFDWPLEGREGVNLLRYDTGGFYKPHGDRADLPAWPPAAERGGGGAKPAARSFARPAGVIRSVVHSRSVRTRTM